MLGRIETTDATDHGPRPVTHAGTPDATEEAVDMALLLSLEGAQVEGEPDLIVELIDLYDEDTPRRLAAIRSALAEMDLVALRRAAHGLKGSSASLGARRVAALCDELEALPDEDSAREGEALLARLERELERARRAFADERERRLATG